MNIVSIEPTPSPNSMKINLDEVLPAGVQKTYTPEHKVNAPELFRRILSIEGVRSLFHTADFIALDRYPHGDWQSILIATREAFGESMEGKDPWTGTEEEGYGEVKVYVQTFRRIPMQIRAKTWKEESRMALSTRFVEAAMKAGMASPTLLKERKLEEWGTRYGTPEEVAEAVMEEIEASYDEERLNALKEKAAQSGPDEAEADEELEHDLPPSNVSERLDDPRWQRRYAALERMKPTEESLYVLEKALQDANASIRRLAVVYLGDIGGKSVLSFLHKALKDPSVAVRRTAGDTLSDLGDPDSIGPMAEALKDPSKIVRWRAARFLYETGDKTATAALKAAEDEPEFEVKMQINMALERIEGGEEAKGAVWQQMTRMRERDRPR